MIHIHDKEVNKIAECNLLHDIINPIKRAKNLNSNYSPIINECMNNRLDIARFKNSRILFGSVCSSTIVMVRLVEKLRLEKDAVMQWQTQAGNITTNIKVKVDFTVPALSATNVRTCKCHVYESAKGIYDMILGQDLLTELWLNLKFLNMSLNQMMELLKTTPMVDLGMYIFRYSNTGKITPEESFTNAYIEEVYDSDHVRTAEHN